METEKTDRGGVVEVEMSFFDALPMVSLGIGQAKETFLQEIAIHVERASRSANRGHVLFLVPKCERNVLNSVGI
jgi:hypothetical protein